jgi:hypothetical protein
VWRGAERARNLCRICSETRLFHARKCVCSTPLFVCRNRVMCGVVGFVGFVLGSLAPLPSHPSSRCFVCLVGGQRELIFSVSIAPSTFFDAPPLFVWCVRAIWRCVVCAGLVCAKFLFHTAQGYGVRVQTLPLNIACFVWCFAVTEYAYN